MCRLRTGRITRHESAETAYFNTEYHNMKEYFVDIIGFENHYQISNLGRIKSLGGLICKSGKVRKHTIKFLSQGLSKNGYYMISLSVGSKRKSFTVHRLIAVHFVPNPDNKAEVNHINGIKTDNRIENLEWVTHKENSHHAWKMGLKTAAMKGITGYANKLSIPITCINTGEVFASAAEASKILKVARPNIVKVLKGDRNHANGLRFKYKEAI